MSILNNKIAIIQYEINKRTEWAIDLMKNGYHSAARDQLQIAKGLNVAFRILIDK